MELGRFARDRGGSLAPIFAIALIPVVALVGAAVDYSRTNAIHAALQAAVDSTTLAMARNAFALTSAQLQVQASAYFSGAFNRGDAQRPAIAIATARTSDGTLVAATGSAIVPTVFMGLVGLNNIPISASSTVRLGTTPGPNGKRMRTFRYDGRHWQETSPMQIAK